MPYRGPGLRPSLPSISSPRAICRADEQSGIIRELCEIRFTFFLSSEFFRVAFLFPESVRTLHWHHVSMDAHYSFFGELCYEKNQA